MGLNVLAVSKLTKAAVQKPDDYDVSTQFFVDPLSIEEVEKYFPGRHRGIDIGVVYDVGAMSEFSLPYSLYNSWRDQLSAFVDDANPYAFFELINFSDCEGVLGPLVSKKLAYDFSMFEEQARNEGGIFYEIYMWWKKAFEIAADEGAVQFQ